MSYYGDTVIETPTKHVDIDYHVVMEETDISDELDTHPGIITRETLAKTHDLHHTWGATRHLRDRMPADIERDIKRGIWGFKRYLHDVNLSLFLVSFSVFVILVMSMAYTAINVNNNNPQCHFSETNIHSDESKNNGDFCISVTKENTMFYCCKGNFHWCLKPECKSRMLINDEAFSIANLTISGIFVIAVLVVMMIIGDHMFYFKKTFNEMFGK